MDMTKQQAPLETQQQPQIQQQYKPQQIQQQQKQQQQHYKPFPQPYNQYQPLAYQQTSPGVVGMVGDGPIPNPQVGHQMVQQNNVLESHSPRSHTPIGVHPHGQIGGGHHTYTPPMGPQLSPQARPPGLMPMGHPPQGMTGYGGANGNLQSMDGSVVRPQSQKSFQQAPGAVRLPAGPTSGPVQVSQYTGHKTPPPIHPHQQSSLSQSPSGGRPILSGQYTHSPAYNQGYPTSSPYSNNTSMANSNAGYPSNAVGGMSSHQQQMSNLSYGSSFPQAQAPSPQSLNSPNANPLLSLLSSSNLGPDFPLSQAMLALATSGPNMPTNRSVISQNAGNLSYSQLANDDGGGMRYGYSNVGRIGLNDDGNQNMMLPREAFNKEEPELKFAEINLDVRIFFYLLLSTLCSRELLVTSQPLNLKQIP